MASLTEFHNAAKQLFGDGVNLGVSIVNRFLDFLWGLVVAIFFPALAAVCLSNAIAINAELNTDTYAITIVRLGLGAAFIAVASLFVLKKSNI